VRLNDIPPIVRAAGSLLCIAAGIALLYFTWFDGEDSEGSTEQAAPEMPAPVNRCPDGMADFDNTVLRFRICLPSNLVYSNGVTTSALADANQQDPQFINDFHVVNLAWLLPWASPPPSDPAIAPMRLAVRLEPPDLGIEGCPLRQAPPSPTGVLACSDGFFVDQSGDHLDPNGFMHRYRAILPHTGPNGTRLYMQVDSPAEAWPIQQPLVEEILNSIETY
jgi:hypothetical protein